MRVGGSDNTTSNYNYQRLILGASTFNNTRDTNQTAGTICDIGTENSNQEITFFNPFETQLTYFYVFGCVNASSPQVQQWFNSFNATTSFTGFSIFPTSETLTGEILVYGMKV